MLRFLCRASYIFRTLKSGNISCLFRERTFILVLLIALKSTGKFNIVNSKLKNGGGGGGVIGNDYTSYIEGYLRTYLYIPNTIIALFKHQIAIIRALGLRQYYV